jgi:hypothetical protein
LWSKKHHHDDHDNDSDDNKNDNNDNNTNNYSNNKDNNNDNRDEKIEQNNHKLKNNKIINESKNKSSKDIIYSYFYNGSIIKSGFHALNLENDQVIDIYEYV